MQIAEKSIKYKYDKFYIVVTVLNEKQFRMAVTDNVGRTEFYGDLLELKEVSTRTLIRGIERKVGQVTIRMEEKGVGDDQVLELTITVVSKFLKPISQTISLKRVRNVSKMKIFQNQVRLVLQKIQSLRQKLKNKPNLPKCGLVQQKQICYNTGSNHDQIAFITLPKGKYDLTLSFLTKPTKKWMYLYFHRTQQAIPTSGFHSPSSEHFVAMIVHKLYVVEQEEEKVTFNTYCAESYPFALRNVVLTAVQRL